MRLFATMGVIRYLDLSRSSAPVSRPRTRVATLFPNEASLLRLASAVLSEISDEWETGKLYLNMKAQ